jgi:hypothetical protein
MVLPMGLLLITQQLEPQQLVRQHQLLVQQPQQSLLLLPLPMEPRLELKGFLHIEWHQLEQQILPCFHKQLDQEQLDQQELTLTYFSPFSLNLTCTSSASEFLC